MLPTFGKMVTFDGALVPGVCLVQSLAGRLSVTVQVWTPSDRERLGEMMLALERGGAADVRLETHALTGARAVTSSVVKFYSVSTPQRIDSRGLYETVFSFLEVQS